MTRDPAATDITADTRPSFSDVLEAARIDVIPTITDRRSGINRTEETARRLSATAFALFEERGYDSVTVADIAGMAGVTARTFYRYFPGKETLLIDVSDHINDRFAELIASEIPGGSADEVMPSALVLLCDELRDVIEYMSKLTAASDSLMSMQMLNSQRWESRLAGTIEDRFGSTLSRDDCLIWAAILFSFFRLAVSTAEDWPPADRARALVERLQHLRTK